MGWEFSGVVRFDLGPLLQGQMRITKVKGAYNLPIGGHGGRVVTLSPPTSEAGVRSPHGLKWESWLLLAVGRQFTVHNPSELYVLVSSALPTTRRDMTCTVLKATLNPK